MGKGGGECTSRTPMTVSASAPVGVPRPLADWTDEALEAEMLRAEFERDRAQLKLAEQERWRRPGGSGFEAGQEIRPGLTVTAIDADRLRIICDLPDDGGQISLTQNQAIKLLSDGRIPTPTTPDKRKPPAPVDYGQHVPRPPRVHPSHLPVEGRAESVTFAAQRKQIDDRRDWMSEIRGNTDIVEFEKMYWEQAKANLQLTRDVEAAGGLDPDTGMWGVRYILADPARAAQHEDQLRQIYEHIKGLRDAGRPDEDIIAFLEDVYDSPFGGPQPQVS